MIEHKERVEDLRRNDQSHVQVESVAELLLDTVIVSISIDIVNIAISVG